ncbi:MAG: sporulation initiation factor Spo0A C-terminal domain-containing protein [Clostridia bacterium]|nr:sporulation initiation factor Spo0A C-terminal domain-containing protein [Clostridia bacterium]
MKQVEEKIKKVLLRMGISPALKGYRYLAEGILIQKRNFEAGRSREPMMSVYTTLAEKYGDTPSKVERAMRTAIGKIFDSYDPQRDQFFKKMIHPHSGKVSNGTFICMMEERLLFKGGEG